MTLPTRSCWFLMAVALLAITTAPGNGAKPDARLREVLTLQHDSEAIDQVAVSPDGKRIVACCSPWQHPARANLFIRGHAKVWDADSGKLILTLSPNEQCVSFATFSPDGKRLLAGHIGAEPNSEEHLHAITIWDAATGKAQLTTRKLAGRVSCVAFTPDGQRFVSGHWGAKQGVPGELIVWDAKTGKELLALEGHKDWVNCLAVTPDGKRIVSGGADGTARVWDAKTGKELLVYKGHDESVRDLAVSRDGKRVVSTQGVWSPKKARVLIWDLATGKSLVEIAGLKGMVRCVAFHPDGGSIVGGVQWTDTAPPRLAVWDAATGEVAAKADVEFPVTTMTFHPDGKRLVTGDARKSVKVWVLER